MPFTTNRTGAPQHDIVSHTKLIVRVLQDLTRNRRFTDYTDLKETLKEKLAALKIHYNGTLIADALDRIELGGRANLIASRLPKRATRQHERYEEPVLRPDEAKQLHHALMTRYETELAKKAKVLAEKNAL